MEDLGRRRKFLQAGILGSIGFILGSAGIPKVSVAGESSLQQPLLDEAIAAHGGLNRWRELTQFSVRMSLYGQLFDRKGHGGGELAHLDCEGTTREQYFRMTGFREPDLRLTYRPERVALERTDGTLLQARINPSDAFAGHTAMSQWDDLHLAYFCGYANWNYFVVPFVFADPGFECVEDGIWQENGETWRRLRVTYPPGFVTHTRVQTFYFDGKGLLRRLDYGPTLAGPGHVAHYCDEHKIFNGIVMPTRRRAYRLEADGNVVKSLLLVGLDISSAEFS
ncbi:hypothetical protein [Paraburkholderia sp. BR13444]|uniref:hypothetical protein n=1 Tax=Paraburkholderia sp. BR13444 TaxID=3236997 RepID=UPI0034CFCB61